MIAGTLCAVQLAVLLHSATELTCAIGHSLPPKRNESPLLNLLPLHGPSPENFFKQ